jgi:uncharacterized protein (DUF427 family)
MPKAIWQGVVLAEAPQEACEIVEGNTYFPPQAIHRAYFRESDQHTVCPWKGTASYYDIVVEDRVNKDAAWYYPQPKDAARHITGYIAFWRGVNVEQ